MSVISSRIFLLFAVVLAISDGQSPALAQAVATEPLVWKLKAGEEYRFKMSQKMDMVLDMGAAGKMENSIGMDMDWLWNVTKVDDDKNAVVEQKIERMKMHIQAGGQDLKIDSGSDEKPTGRAAVLLPVVKAMTEAAITITMTPSGEITEVDVPEDLIKKMQSSPNSAVMGELASKKGFEQLASQSTLPLPKDGKLEVGSTWSDTVEIENSKFGKNVIEKTYEYAGQREQDGKTYEVFKPTLVIRFEKQAGDEGPKIEVKKQNSSGEILFDREAGMIEQSTINQGLELVISVGEQTMSQKINQSVVFKRQDDKKE